VLKISGVSNGAGLKSAAKIATKAISAIEIYLKHNGGVTTQPLDPSIPVQRSAPL
jgi:hypothetical protein